MKAGTQAHTEWENIFSCKRETEKKAATAAYKWYTYNDIQ